MGNEVKTGAETIAPATGKLGVMVVGLGAVATTFIAGVEAVRRGIAPPIGSLTQMGTIRLGKRTDANSPKVKDFVPLAKIEDIVFTGWDIFEDNVYESASNAKVLEKDLLLQLKPYLETIKPLPAVFDQFYVKRLSGTNVKKGKNKKDLADQVIQDIRNFKKTVDRVVMIWCGSTEIFLEPTAVHKSVAAFEKGLEASDPGIAPSQIYAYAALSEGVPFANGAPNLTVDFPAMIELSKKTGAPICGKDFKTGQTLLKTVLRRRSRRDCWVWQAGTRRTFWAIAMAKCWMTRRASRRRKNRSLECWSTFCSLICILICTRISSTR